MSLPKRDGVHDRYYLIHKPDTSPEVLAEADLCIQDVLNGTARENHSAYPTVVRNLLAATFTNLFRILWKKKSAQSMPPEIQKECRRIKDKEN